MTELDQIIQVNRTVTADIVARAQAIPADKWTVPRAPEKWSPAQVVEHVTKSYEGHRGMIAHEVPLSVSGKLKAWVARAFFLPRLFAAGDFTQKGLKSPKFILPSDVPAPPSELLSRFEAASVGLEEDVQRAVEKGWEKVVHPFFGKLDPADFLQFVVIHGRHHAPQIVPAK